MNMVKYYKYCFMDEIGFGWVSGTGVVTMNAR